MMAFRCCCAVLLLALCYAVYADAPQTVRALLLRFPADVPPEQVMVLAGQSARGASMTQIDTQVGVTDYRIPVADTAQMLRLVLYRPGYRVVTATYDAAMLPMAAPFVPQFNALPTQTLTLKFLSPDNKPLPNTHVTLSYQFGGRSHAVQLADGATNADGVSVLSVPAFADDPYFAPNKRSGKQTKTLHVSLKGIPSNAVTPTTIPIQRQYAAPTIITVAQHAKLTGSIPLADIRAQGLTGDIVATSSRNKIVVATTARVVLLADGAQGRTINCNLTSKGKFSVSLPAGAYQLELAQIDPGQTTPSKRIPLNKTVTLSAGETRTIQLGAQ